MIKKLLIVFAAFGLFTLVSPKLASAQETWSIGPVPASQVSKAADQVALSNAKVCRKFSLPDTCTQAQACTAAGAPGGSSCTAAQARGANVRIFPATQAGREEYITFNFIIPGLDDRQAQVVGDNRTKQCQFWVSANAAQRSALCTASGLPSTCDLSCPGF